MLIFHQIILQFHTEEKWKMILKNHELETKTYWRARIDIRNSVSKSEYVDKLRYLLWDATKIRMISDVPYGAFLSGGIDSSLITAKAQELSSKKIKTFCIGNENKSHDESKYASKVAKFLSTDHDELILNKKKRPTTTTFKNGKPQYFQFFKNSELK